MHLHGCAVPLKQHEGISSSLLSHSAGAKTAERPCTCVGVNVKITTRETTTIRSHDIVLNQIVRIYIPTNIYCTSFPFRAKTDLDWSDTDL